ncbi:MAG: phage integrase SAM-like domain-containing protein [Nitrospiraceae bacterium]|jgi:integrase|nr:phage integrase SAM-like domain-containing protein [Nitrospiraceae bacterium]
MPQIVEQHKKQDGRLHIIRHEGSRVYLWRAFFDGKYYVKSTKETNLATAIKLAEEAYTRLRFHREQTGIPVHDHTWDDATKELLQEQKTRVALKERGTHHVQDYEVKLRVLDRFFEGKPLHAITHDLLENYKTWRITGSQNLPKVFRNNVISMKTLHQDFIVIRQTLKFAKRKGWITALPDMPQIRVKAVARPWFSREDYRKLLKVSTSRIKTSLTPNQKLARQELHDLIIFLAHTGVRIGEMRGIRRKDVKMWEGNKHNEKDRCFIRVKGKTGLRECIGMFGAVRVVERIDKRRHLGPEDKLFPTHNVRQFVALLNAAELRYDSEENRRDLKSLRHTFIMFRLLEGVDVFLLATNCGTSVKIISQHYGKHLTARMKSDELVKLTIGTRQLSPYEG